MCGISGTIKWGTLTIVHQPYDDECLRFWHARHDEHAPKGKPCDCDAKLAACGCPWDPDEASAAPPPSAVAPAPAPVAQPPSAVAPPAAKPPAAKPAAPAIPDTFDLELDLKAAIQKWIDKKTKK